MAVPSDVYEASPIIRKIWRVFGTKTLVAAFAPRLLDIITGITSQGREIILSCLQDSVTTKSGIKCVISAGLFGFILDSLKDDTLACASCACECFSVETVVERVQKISEIACCSDTVKYRVFELCVKVATASDAGFECCVERDVFNCLNACRFGS